MRDNLARKYNQDENPENVSEEIKKLSGDLKQKSGEVEEIVDGLLNKLRALGINVDSESTETRNILERDQAFMRTKNMLDQAMMMQEYAEGGQITESDKKILAGLVSESNWQSIFSQMKTGENLAFFATPGGELSIKNLNTILGEQVTDNLIKLRKDTLIKIAKENKTSVLLQDFKGGFVKLPDDLSKEESTRLLNEISGKINVVMSEAVRKELDKLLQSGKGKEINFARLNEILTATNEETEELLVGYRMNWGMSEVGEAQGEDDYSHILEAVAKAGVSAQFGRRFDGDKYGVSYDREIINNEINEIQGLGESLIGKSIVDTNGIKYEIFSPDRQGYRVLNKDLARLIRKGELLPAQNSIATVKILEQYVRRINLLDMVKPFVAKEASDGTLAKKNKQLEKYIVQLPNGPELNDQLLAEEKKELVAELRMNAKDKRFLADQFFHYEAMKLDNCAYVNIDVLDLGVDLLLEYERALQMAHRNPEETQKIMSQAGDNITTQMREIRGRALAVYEKYFGQDAEVIGKVGGDELAFALDNNVSPEMMSRFMMDLQKETGTRVIKTVVAEAERKNNQAWEPGVNGKEDDERLAEHLQALKRAENGTKICKEIEKKMRFAKKIIESKNPLNQDLIKAELEKSGLAMFENMAVKEGEDGHFIVIYESNGQELSIIDGDQALKMIEQKIDSLKRDYAG